MLAEQTEKAIGSPVRPVVTASDIWITRSAGILGVLATLFFAGTVLALHWVRPDIGVVQNYVSEYANGPWGALFSVSSFVHGVGNLAVAAGLWLALPGSPIGRAGAALFGLSAVGVLVAAVFSADPIEAPATVSGDVHLLAAFLSFAVEAIALCLLAVSFGRLPAWRRFAPATATLMAVGAISLAVLLYFRTTGMSPGIAERIALAAFVGWELAAAVRLATVRMVGTSTSAGNDA